MPIGDILNAVSQFALGTANLIYNGVSAHRARQDQLMMYNNTLPARQMALRRAAGLNPYGDIGQVGANVPTPVNTAGSLDSSFQMMGQGLNNAMQYKFQRLANAISFRQLENEYTRLGIERDKLEKDKQIADSNIRNLDARTSYQQIENWILDMVKQNRVDLSDYEVKQAAENLFSSMIGNTYQPEFLAQQINKLIEEVNSIKEGVGIAKREVAVKEKANTFLENKDTREQEIHKFNVEQLEFDKATIEAINLLIDNVLSNSKMSEKSKAIIVSLLRAGASYGLKDK